VKRELLPNDWDSELFSQCGKSFSTACHSQKTTDCIHETSSFFNKNTDDGSQKDKNSISSIAVMLQKASARKSFVKSSNLFRLFVLMLVAIVVLAQAGPLFQNSASVLAETTINLGGTVSGTNVNMRSAPDSSTQNVVAVLNANGIVGERVFVLSQVTGQMTSSYGDQWYKLEYTKADGTKISGYIVSGLVTLDAPVDDAYDAELQSKGFPASYWPFLRSLHEKHPSWEFTAFPVKYNWEKILDEQSRTGRSLIPVTWSNALKSYAADAYNYATDTWIIHDSSSWVMANRQTIGYYMDPRNWLNENNVFMFENLKYNKNVHNRSGVVNILSGSFMADGVETFSYERMDATYKIVKDTSGNTIIDSATHVDVFMEAATRTQVSPYHLASRSRLEIGKTKSGSVTGTYQDPYKTLDLTGLYNYYNIGATQGTYPIRNGLEYAKYGPGRKPEQTDTDNLYLIPWNNPWRSIVGGAIFIGNSYINRNQHTLYLQKFDLDDTYDGAFWHQYMGNLDAPRYEGNETYKAYLEMGQMENNFEFIIPVIPGIPEKPVAKPTDARSRNHWLKTMTVEGITLSPAFDPAKTEYTTTVNNDETKATITAAPVNSKAKISGTGTYNLAEGNNIIKLTVTAESGEKRVYTISITRKAADGTVPPDVITPQDPIPALTFDQQILKVSGETVTGVDPAKSLNQVELFTASLGIPAGYQVQVLDAAGKPQQNLVGTGNIVQISFENLLTQRYTVIVYGDTDGDGRITSADLNRTFNHVLQKSTLNGAFASAADADKDGKVTSADLNRIFNHVLQKAALAQ
jgi:beta-N-acetylglucosaminidase